METQRWRIDPETFGLDGNPLIQEAASYLKKGGLVAFPTETVYGLGANATSREAVASIFRAKGRPSDNPLIVHIADPTQISHWVGEISEKGRTLAHRFWPGPLTLVLPHRGNLAPEVTAGLPTVGIRIPSHPVALALLKACQLPVAAPSANRSGKPSPTQADHVWKDLSGRIDGLLDGGMTGVGVESTVVDVTAETPVLLRPGGITLEMLQEAVGEIVVDLGLESEIKAPRSPGMKYRHYAPHGTMWLVTGEADALTRRVQELADEGFRKGKTVGILTTEEKVQEYQADWIIPCGRKSEPESIAKGLYQSLRTFDEVGAEWIVAEGFPSEGVLFSVMNRLIKAAEGRVIKA
ncbi:L-threonylcarbamoyladenylate synthase [Melghirimyces algeriensis]|uniref:Threonylcarbamoyl-AMP synthase n=1 Tax=Melghirimyces algeriensis TaxID=910412 RepID=A0A521D934_9BACL|nr:L-threonylcarbamoyladenylate synthase [Melghirimyces algeriensis]SMO67390.1 L-threonylcarbamoyladenylate synthase [Melghirimyces algeriensis]